MKRKILFWIYNVLVTLLPRGRCALLKVWWLRFAGVNVGRKVDIGQFVRFFGQGEIVIGDGVRINSFAMIETSSKIEIGEGVEINSGTILSANGESALTIGRCCHIAHNVSIKCSEHMIDLQHSSGSIAGKSVFRDINIGEGCWICSGVTIIPGVRIGSYCVVAAGAVVTRDAPSGVLLAGVPAIVKKKYSIQGGVK